MWKRSMLVLMLVICAVSTLWAAPKPRNMKITEIRPLSFGYLTSGQSAVTVDPVNPPVGTYPGQISISGEPWMGFQVVLPASVDLKNGVQVLTITGFQTDLVNDQGILDGLGESVIQIGATIGPIPLNAGGGTYSGRGVISVYYLY